MLDVTATSSQVRGGGSFRGPTKVLRGLISPECQAVLSLLSIASYLEKKKKSFVLHGHRGVFVHHLHLLLQSCVGRFLSNHSFYQTRCYPERSRRQGATNGTPEEKSKAEEEISPPRCSYRFIHMLDVFLSAVLGCRDALLISLAVFFPSRTDSQNISESY